MWLEDVHIPWERMFLVDQSPELIARWLFWHQLYCWLSKAEVTLGLALTLTDAMGLMKDVTTNEYLLDLITDVQTVRSCQVAAERDPQFTQAGYCFPNLCHLAAGSIAMLKARPRMSEMLRIVPGSSLVVAPTDRDLAAPEMAGGLRGNLRRRWLYRLAAVGFVADGMGPRLLGAGGAQVGVRIACERRHPSVARTAAHWLRTL